MTVLDRFRISLALAVLASLSACEDDVPVAPPSPTTSASNGATTSPPAVPGGPDATQPVPDTPKFVSRIEEPEDPKIGDVVLVREFHDNSVLATERTEICAPEGKRIRQGPMKAWHSNGELQIEGGYDDQGRLTGHWRYYDEQGEIQREGDYEAGLRAGDWTEYWPGGQMKSQGLLHVGLCEGPWKYWYENGQPMAEGSYVNNRREGPWLFWEPDGKPDLKQTGEYKEHVRVK